MIDNLFVLLRDPDYRVRFFLARRIGVLFEEWDGHFDLFQDVWYVNQNYFYITSLIITTVTYMLYFWREVTLDC